MATTIVKPVHTVRNYRRKRSDFSYVQTVNMAMGFILIVLGLAGLLYSEFMGMHLTPVHSLVLCAAGCLSIWVSNHGDSKQLFWASFGLGSFFALNAIVGFSLGAFGEPSVGYRAPDALLIKIAPGFIELGLIDHCVHAFLSMFFFTGAFSSRR